jgi:hypothetical protein
MPGLTPTLFPPERVERERESSRRPSAPKAHRSRREREWGFVKDRRNPYHRNEIDKYLEVIRVKERRTLHGTGRGSSWLCFLSVIVALGSQYAGAQNLLTNPGAETGDFTGWTRGGSPSGQPVIDPWTDIPSPPNHTGDHRFGISVGWAEADCYQYQTFPVEPYHRYEVDLWYSKQDGTDDFLVVSWANGAFGAPEDVLYNLGGNRPGWNQVQGQTFVPSTNEATLVLHYRHIYATNIASIHVDDIEVRDVGEVDTPTPRSTPTVTPTFRIEGTPTPTPTGGTPPPEVPLANAGFEDGFTGGLADGWTGFQVRTGGFVKPNERLGRLGGGIYGCYIGIDPPEPGYSCIDEYESIRMSAKTYGIDMSRYDLVGQIQSELGPEVVTVARVGPENFIEIYPDGDTWENNPERDGEIFADYLHNNWITTHDFEADAYYSLNEPSVNVAADLAKVCLFDLAFTRRMHELGHRACVMNNSVGTPSPLDLVLTVPEFRQLAAEADYFGYHNYGDWDTGWMCPESAGPWTYRWQTVVEWYAQRGWRHPPVAYTESGHYWWVGEKTPQEVSNDLVCYEARERTEEFWSLGIHYFVTGAWHSPGDSTYNGWNQMNLSLFPEIITACRSANQAHPVDAHGGVASQEIGGSGEAFDRGIVQRFSTEPGNSYEVRAWVKYEHEGWPNRATIHVGWDPTGQMANATAGTVQWSPDLIHQGENNPISDGPWDSDIWYQYRGTFQATSSEASVWFRGVQVSGTRPARIYVDDVRVVGAVAESGPPTMTVR